MQPNSYNTIMTVTDDYLQLFIMLCSPSSVIIQHQLNISWRRLAPQLNQKYAQHVSNIQHCDNINDNTDGSIQLFHTSLLYAITK